LTHLEGPFCLRRVLVFCAEDESQHLRHRTQRDGRLGLPPVVTAAGCTGPPSLCGDATGSASGKPGGWA